MVVHGRVVLVVVVGGGTVGRVVVVVDLPGLVVLVVVVPGLWGDPVGWFPRLVVVLRPGAVTTGSPPS